MKKMYQYLMFAFILLIIGIMKHNEIISDVESITAIILTILLLIVFFFFKKEKKEKNKELESLFN